MPRSPAVPSADAPDLASTEAAEVKALEEIEAMFPADAWAKFLARLQGPGMIVATGDPKVSELIGKYYEASLRASHERTRFLAVLDARRRGPIDVVVALGDPEDGQAEVLRRLDNIPSEVIVLARDATADVLAAALDRLERSRECDGDAFAMRLSVGDVKTIIPDPKRDEALAKALEKLHGAPTRTIEGVGTVQAIELRTGPVR